MIVNEDRGVACMAQTQRKPVYIQPDHHEMLRQLAYEQHCNLSDVLDAVLEETDWKKIAAIASTKPQHRAAERASRYNS